MKNLLNKLKRSGLTVTQKEDNTFEVKATTTGAVLFASATASQLERLSQNISVNQRDTRGAVRNGLYTRSVIAYR